MSPRELIIFLLGLAIVAVILRGLYVAMQARRGQIKLSIDKNIPQDIDLDALELAELPGGGARVVERSLAAVNTQNSAIEAANERAASLGLGTADAEEESIPVLMDPVELNDEIAAEDDAEDYDQFSSEARDSQAEPIGYEDPDSVLFDYAEDEEASTSKDDEYADDDLEEDTQRPMYREDNMSSVMPDYPEDEWGDDDDEDEEEIPEGFHEEDFGGASFAEDDWAPAAAEPQKQEEELDEEFATDEEIIAAFKGRQAASSAPDDTEEVFDDIDGYDFDDDDEEQVDAIEERHEPSIGESFEDSLDEFSMTAGDRIGYNAPQKAESGQPELFDEEVIQEDEGASDTKEKSGFRSLLSAFGKSNKADDTDGADTSVEDSEESDSFEADALDQSFNGRKISSIEDATTARVDDEESQQYAEVDAEQDAIQQSEVIVLNVVARENRAFDGNDLLQVLITAGLKFGEMNIFHHRLNNDNKGPVIFSVANILNPGTFNLNDMEEFSTIGISLFLALPTQINNLQAFEQMLGVAQQVRGALDGELKDDHRNVMTAQTIEHYRQRIRDFELRQLKAAGSRA
ncbi:MAG: cell division protein ZipA [Pseudomonadales bacterium]|nr:cell division protein ZipA [Pseudomonadales bacterium]